MKRSPAREGDLPARRVGRAAERTDGRAGRRRFGKTTSNRQNSCRSPIPSPRGHVHLRFARQALGGCTQPDKKSPGGERVPAIPELRQNVAPRRTAPENVRP